MKDFDLASPMAIKLAVCLLGFAVLFHSPLTWIAWAVLRLAFLLAASWGVAYVVNQRFKTLFPGWAVAGLVFIFGWGLVV